MATLFTSFVAAHPYVSALSVLVLVTAPVWLGVVVIGERQVGVVVKKFSRRTLPVGRLVALDGEAGYQAETLAPGVRFGYWFWQYSVRKVAVTVIPQGEIGLVVAADGKALAGERILGRAVRCNAFQDARAFLTGGGEKGRQLAILTAGTYRINTALFEVITRHSAAAHGMAPEALRVHRIEADRVGIVTTLDGAPIEPGEIAGATVPGHDSFQGGQAFIESGGRRGLQEQVLLSGSWNLNPWFVQVEQVPMTEIPIGHVGVVISFVGQAHEDVSGVDFKHGDLVDPGHKGVWVSPLYPGKHPLNTRVMRVELVPTTNIVLNWAGRTEAHNYDAKLSSITVRSRDGFAFTLDVSQIIHVAAPDAPKVISRVGSMQNLVDHGLQPIVGNYFRNAAQAYTVLDFLSARSERQKEATQHIRAAIGAYDVQAIDTLIGDINPPEALMSTLTDRKIAEEQKKTFEVQEAAQKQRQQLVRETATAEIQQQMVKAEQGVRISELEASAQVKRSAGEAESFRLRASGESEGIRLKGAGEAEAIRATGTAKAEAYRAGVESLGPQSYATLQLIQVVGERNVRIVPDVSVSNGEGGDGLVAALLGSLMRERTGGSSSQAVK
jgi:uncharacterized membrane protein YqiK